MTHRVRGPRNLGLLLQVSLRSDALRHTPRPVGASLLANARVRECGGSFIVDAWSCKVGNNARRFTPPKGTTVPPNVPSPPPSSDPLLEVRRLTRLDQSGANQLLKPTDFTL